MALELVTQRKPGEGETAGSGTAGRRPEEQRPATADGDRKGDRRTGGGTQWANNGLGVSPDRRGNTLRLRVNGRRVVVFLGEGAHYVRLESIARNSYLCRVIRGTRRDQCHAR